MGKQTDTRVSTSNDGTAGHSHHKRLPSKRQSRLTLNASLARANDEPLFSSNSYREPAATWTLTDWMCSGTSFVATRIRFGSVVIRVGG